MYKIWPAPAKLNLMLRILGQRKDGYHRLQTVFQFIDWCDYLTFELLDEDRICRVGKDYGVCESEDLIVRAARLLKKQGGVSQGVSITIDKNLPMGGGLGGGSSDAATTLVALNELWSVGLSVDELVKLGASLGADVPVFVKGRAAWAEGVGDELTPVDLDEPYYLLIMPGCHVSTAEVFANSRLTRDSKAITMCAFLDGDQQNDCLSVVQGEYPAVDYALKCLAKVASAKLTGTGSTVYAVFNEAALAQQAAKQLPEELDVKIVKGLNRSPLLSEEISSLA